MGEGMTREEKDVRQRSQPILIYVAPVPTPKDHHSQLRFPSPIRQIYSPAMNTDENILHREITHVDSDSKKTLKDVYSDFHEKSRAQEDSFFMSMRAPLLLAQVFGIMPLCGLLGYSPDKIEFKWRHWKMAYTAFIVTASLFFSVCSLLHCIKDGITFDGSAALVFYVGALISTILFTNLGKNWRSINKQFARVELILFDYGYPEGQKWKFMAITTAFSLCALIEHLLANIKGMVDVVACRRESDSNSDLARMFFEGSFSEVFQVLNYHLSLGILMMLTSFIITFGWNFVDLFLGLMSIALAEKIKQINKTFANVHGKAKPSVFWRKLREEFNALSVLVKYIDKNLQKMMLLSLGSNLFFICLQLLKSLRKRVNAYHTLYFFWSFGFLIFRTIFVTMCASEIYDDSREGRSALFSVPHGSFCVEVRRLITQISTDELALTGCRFFSVTRGLILTIAGTVVTYEIVLVQFRSDITPEFNTTQCSI